LELLERSTIRVIMPSRTLLADRPVLSFVAGMVLVTACLSPGTPVGAGDNWAAYLGHPSSNQYSTLGQINKGNVDELEVAWTYDTGDSAEYQSNNLIVDGVLFTASPSRKVMALNGATGTHLWTFDPDELNPYGGSMYQGGGRQRGVMYWEDGDDRHIFTVKGPWLYALDAKTGEPISSFGDGGWIHLGDQMDVEGRPNVGLNTPGYVYHDLLIIGANVNEDVPGAIRAFDVRTGERKWIFHTLPRPGEPGSETWPDDYLAWTGGASDWSGIAVDTARGIVYASTESAGPDFYGGFRYGQNLFANSVVALDADTGEPLWHYQIVHHDLWDFDLPTPPTLLTVTHDGRRVDALAQGTKMGLLFVFDRVTGEPLWPIEERPAPESRLPDMRSWPTQPFPTRPAPLMRQCSRKRSYFPATTAGLNGVGRRQTRTASSTSTSTRYPGSTSSSPRRDRAASLFLRASGCTGSTAPLATASNYPGVRGAAFLRWLTSRTGARRTTSLRSSRSQALGCRRSIKFLSGSGRRSSTSYSAELSRKRASRARTRARTP
jgi:glucose dehydrogenase